MPDLRHGHWQDVLRDVNECSAVITDPPYDKRVLSGYRSGSDPGGARIRIGYDCNEYIPQKFMRHWAERATDWIIVWCSHQQFAALEDGALMVGWKSFAPVGWIKTDAAPRMCGDGPTCSVEYLFIARPVGWPKRRGSRPGHYLVRRGKTEKPRIIIGQNPLDAVRAVVRDYTEPGSLIVDPHAGSGTTLLAAHLEGRRAIGAESDKTTYAAAIERLRQEEPWKQSSTSE